MSPALPQARFSVGTLFVVIAGVAATLSLLRDSEHPLATGFVLAMWYALAIGIVGALWGTDRWSHFCAGFALCAGPFFFLFSPDRYLFYFYRPTFGCSDSIKEMVVSWLPPPKPEESSSPYGLLPPPVAATDPSELFPQTAAVEPLDLEIDPLSIAVKVFGLGSPPPDLLVCICGGDEPPPPPATAILHCLCTLLVGICGAATVCWLQRPQYRG